MADKPTPSSIPDLLADRQKAILDEWVRAQLDAPTWRSDLMTEDELRQQSSDLLGHVRNAARSGNLDDIGAPEWAPVRGSIESFARTRAQQGFSPSEVATFVFSLKQPLFAFLRREHQDEPQRLLDELWRATTLVDKLGLYTSEAYIKNRDRVIERQRQEMLELSTPVVKLWQGVLALPMIGTLDSERAQVVMESLLERIVETGATTAIVDITGVPTVDTLVAQHLLKTIAAAKLMGADCIISGIRPQIAQTIVQLGINLEDVTTKASLADALVLALKRTGHRIEHAPRG